MEGLASGGRGGRDVDQCEGFLESAILAMPDRDAANCRRCLTYSRGNRIGADTQPRRPRVAGTVDPARGLRAADSSVFADPCRSPAVQVQTRKVAHEVENVRTFERLDVFLRNRDHRGIHLVVTFVPIDPFIPFVEIKLAALPALVQRSDRVNTVLWRK